MRRITVVLLLVTLGLALAAFASAMSAPERSCQGFRGHGLRFAVSIRRGNLSCATARKVLTTFIRRDYKKSELSFPLAWRLRHPQAWKVDGWACGHGTGAYCLKGGTTFTGAKEVIFAVPAGRRPAPPRR